MASICENPISILAGNLSSRRSYLITAVAALQKETIWTFLYFIISLPFLLAFSNLIRKVNVGCIQVLALELSKGFIGTYVKGFNRI